MHLIDARPRLILPLLLALAAGAVAVAAAFGAPQASGALLGKPANAPKPNCPRDPCFVLASVTGFQTRAQGVRNPFRVREDGHIVAWQVRMSRPDNAAREFFGDLFGSPNLGTGPTAQIAILRRVGKGRFRLMRQSPTVELSAYYNTSPVITLRRPLRVRRGQIVALTTRTWIPNLIASQRIGRSNWRASRPRGKCGANQARNAKPHRKDGSVREYGCSFGDRVAYWARFAAES